MDSVSLCPTSIKRLHSGTDVWPAICGLLCKVKGDVTFIKSELIEFVNGFFCGLIMQDFKFLDNVSLLMSLLFLRLISLKYTLTYFTNSAFINDQKSKQTCNVVLK